ncbi:hypothetical protein [Streptomyces sp. URMC 125]|uniref:hypothetical protein n=1 Tax=Streptomyces sp. URMC 125 TaxID=3423419 RepID=UPI003F1C34A3
MQRKPLPTLTTTIRTAPQETAPRPRRWARRRRRAAAHHLLRGICYGIGTGLAGLAFWWLEHHL